MASCSGIAVKEITSSRVYLSGVITGLESSKRYCLHYYSWGWKNMPSGNQTYTYFSGVTSLDLAGRACYIPTIDLNAGEQFEVGCHQVEASCESIITQACSKILKYEITEQRYVHFYVRDENSSPVGNTRIEIAGEAKYTGSDGKTYFIMDTKLTYYARAYAPTGYTCTECYESFYHDSDTVINFYMKNIVEDPATVDVYVRDQEGTGVYGAQVYIPTGIGAKTISTNYMGVAVGFTLKKGANHTASITYLPSAWETTHQSTLIFRVDQSGGVTLYVNKIETHVCDEGTRRYLETCLDDSTIYKEICENNMWVPSGETCPVVHSITCYVKNELGVGIKGVRVNCYVKAGDTGDGGYIKFSDLKKGNYNVEIIPPDGYECIDGCAESFTLDSDKTINFTITGEPALCDEGEKRCIWDPSQSRAEIEKCVSGTWVNDSWCPVGATCNNGICGDAPPPPPPPTCSEKNKTECDASPDCYWWDSDNFCHDTPEQTDYPTLTITSDIDIVGGLDAYVDGVKVGLTPITKSFTETDIGKDVSVAGVLADIIGTKGKNVTLSAGSNMVNIEFLMDNKEILAGGTIAGVLLLKYI